MYNINNDISKRINKIMFDLEINQNQLAKILNITQPAISKYLNGRVPPPYVLLQLSNLSGMSIEWILTGNKEAIIKKNIISEKPGEYLTEKTFVEKLELLPMEIRKNIESLIDSILKN
jgi:predicted transcriptional regulator